MSPTPWKQLLSGKYEGASDEYGPHTHAVWGAFAAFRETAWLARVGQPINGSARVSIERSWEEVIPIFEDMDSRKYGPNGHLVEPVARVRKIMPFAREFAWWQKARTDAVRFAGYAGYIPDWMGQKSSAIRARTYEEAVSEYLYEFVSWLLAEIIAADSAHSTYFREQLEWFHAGHFPCGWDGEWPIGRMLVY